MKLDVLQQSVLALVGGLLGWALGKLLDSIIGDKAVYGILVILAICVIYLIQSLLRERTKHIDDNQKRIDNDRSKQTKIN